jgi:peptidoglycan-associated lipoprotein
MKKFNEGEYQKAIAAFKEITSSAQDEAQVAKANFMIGESFRVSNRPKEAIPFFETALQKGYTGQDLLFYYAYALKMNGDYSKAGEIFTKYIAEGTNPDLIYRAQEENKNLAYISHIKEHKYVKINNCGNINTEGAEYSPFIYDNKLIYTGAKKGGITYEATGSSFTDLYMIDWKEGDSCATQTPLAFMDNLNLDGYHEASIAINKDKNMIVFARSNSGDKKDENRDVNLYMLRKDKKGVWSEPELMSINLPNSWDACPAFSADGKTLYFASNREGGFGGIDLYSVSKDSKGAFTKIKNMGKAINSKGNEMFPYVSKEGNLYFASDGHIGLGGLDLFEATRNDGKVAIYNMGKPFNSPADDFSLVYLTHKKGFFASNRTTDGTKGDDDIYYFEDKTPNMRVRYFLAGVSFQEKGDEKNILQNVKLTLKNAEGQILDETTSDNEGKFKFKSRLEIGDEYLISGQFEGFISHSQTFNTTGKGADPSKLSEKDTTDITFETEVVLIENIFKDLEEKNEIVLKNILYDFDDDKILPKAAKELDKLVEFLKSRTDLKVELGSHTDVRGADRYNQKLSQRRANSAVEYILNKGIDSDRIVAKGYGESKLLIPNAVTEDEHQLNRRTTVTVIGKEEVIESEED